jgi:TetR/AcrR family transcriptional regulator
MEPNTKNSIEKRGAQSRAALLRSGRKLFADHGFRGTSVGEIADAAGLRKPSLFHHFPSKDLLYQAVMQEILGELKELIFSPRMASGTFRQELDRLNDEITSFFFKRPEAARLLFREALEPQISPSTQGLASAFNILKKAEEFLSAGMKCGEFVEQNSRQLLLSIAGLHLTYFAIGPLATPFLEAKSDSESALTMRKEAVRNHVASLVMHYTAPAGEPTSLPPTLADPETAPETQADESSES